MKHLPNERIVYFGDTAHVPYGDKSTSDVKRYSVGICHFLAELGCKMIIVACNTASAAAYDTMREYFGRRVIFLDVIEPLVQTVAAQEFQKVGVIGTRVTIGSGVYERKLKMLQPSLDVASMATPLLVPMIEEGFFNNTISHAIIEKYLTEPEYRDIEALLLACTHYPLIRKEIEQFYNGSTTAYQQTFNHPLGKKVIVYDSTDVVAKSAYEILKGRDLLASELSGKHHFYVSQNSESFEKTTKLFHPDGVDLEEMDLWC